MPTLARSKHRSSSRAPTTALAYSRLVCETHHASALETLGTTLFV
jgi:hypothetical protein